MAINTQYINPLYWGIDKLTSTLVALTIGPVTDLISYAHPQVGAYFNNQTEILENGNGPINQILDPEAITALYQEVTAIRESAGLPGKIKLYTAVNAQYEGKGSLLGHALIVPLEQICKKNFNSTLSDEPILEKEELEKTKYTFTDNEVRFQISRAVGQMWGGSLFKIIARVIILALAIFLFISPVGWAGSLILLGSATVLYSLVYFPIELKSDQRAVTILTKRFEKSGYTSFKAAIAARAAAINCLNKIVLQNIDKRKESRLCRLLVSKSGNFRFDISLTSRIEKLEKSLADLKSLQAINSQVITPLAEKPAMEIAQTPLPIKVSETPLIPKIAPTVPKLRRARVSRAVSPLIVSRASLTNPKVKQVSLSASKSQQANSHQFVSQVNKSTQLPLRENRCSQIAGKIANYIPIDLKNFWASLALTTG